MKDTEGRVKLLEMGGMTGCKPHCACIRRQADSMSAEQLAITGRIAMTKAMRGGNMEEAIKKLTSIRAERDEELARACIEIADFALFAELTLMIGVLRTPQRDPFGGMGDVDGVFGDPLRAVRALSASR